MLMSFMVTYCSTRVPLLQQYKERGLIQPLQWPLSTTYPLILHQYIYFFSSKENRYTFMLNPLKYLRQQKPTPSLPLKMAIVGPPKSGKTAGKTHSFPQSVFHSFRVLNILPLLFLSSGTDVCSEIWLGLAVDRQCYAHGA